MDDKVIYDMNRFAVLQYSVTLRQKKRELSNDNNMYTCHGT